MKNTNLLSIPVLMLGLLATSCSSNEDHPSVPSGAEIRFSVVAPQAPRSVSKPETTTASIDYFLLNAFTEKKPFITNLDVNKSGNVWKPATTVYWPASPVNFYAVSPDIKNTSTGKEDNSFLFTYSNNGGIDLLYSVATDQKQTDALNPKPVTLNFRHALSRVAILMKSTNSQIKVKIDKVTLANILQTGEFEFPNETTSQDNKVEGSWSAQQNPVSATVYVGNNEVLTSESKEFSTENYNFALPQTLKPLVKNGNAFEGSYIEVEGVITNENDITLWPNNTTPAENKTADGKGIIRFPLSGQDEVSKWDVGVAYIYSILINEAPGLSGIEFNVTVDEIDYNNNIPLEN